MIKVAICEDQKLMLKGLQSLLLEYNELELVHPSENGRVLLNSIKETTVIPDVILMDIDMPIMNGFETTEAVRKKYKETKILILSSHKGATYVENAILKGAHGYLNKGEEPQVIFNAIKEVERNGCYFNEMLSFNRLQEFMKHGTLKPNYTENQILSARELEVVKLICQLKSTAEIADILNIGETTTNTYRKNIMDKLGIKKSIGIVIYAIKEGIFIP